MAFDSAADFIAANPNWKTTMVTAGLAGTQDAPIIALVGPTTPAGTKGWVWSRGQAPWFIPIPPDYVPGRAATVGTQVSWINTYANVPAPEYPGNMSTSPVGATATQMAVFHQDTSYNDWTWAWFNLRAGDTIDLLSTGNSYQVLATPTFYSGGNGVQFPVKVLTYGTPIANGQTVAVNLNYKNLPPIGLFYATGGLPGGTADSNNGPITPGCEFVSTASGKNLTGVYFYKLSTETLTTHQGGIWRSSDSVLLGSVNFTNETQTGWQYAQVSPPVPIVANVPFKVAVYFPTTHYGNCVSGALPAGGVTKGTYHLSDVGWYHLGAGMAAPATSIGGFYYLVDIATDG